MAPGGSTVDLISSFANIFGTYLVKPVVNRYILSGDVPGLIRMLFLMGIMYAAVAKVSFGYRKLIYRSSEGRKIRYDLFPTVCKTFAPLGSQSPHTKWEIDHIFSK